MNTPSSRALTLRPALIAGMRAWLRIRSAPVSPATIGSRVINIIDDVKLSYLYGYGRR